MNGSSSLFRRIKRTAPRSLLRASISGLCDDHIDFASRVVNGRGAAFCRIAVCVKFAAEGAGLLCGALARIETHKIPAGTNRLVRLVTLGVEGHENAPGLWIAIWAREIVLAIGIEDASLGIVEII